MASWMVHIKISDNLYEYINKNNYNFDNFVIGNLSPDCGKSTEDNITFNPPKQITHFTVSGKKSQCDFEGFFEKYIKSEKDKLKKSFYLGYYVHLITDVLWSKNIVIPTKEKFNIKSLSKSELLWQIKGDWYSLDHLLLKNQPRMKAYTVLKNISQKGFDYEYLDFYKENNISWQMKNIVDYYENPPENENREYIYLTKIQMDDFIKGATQKITKKLEQKLIL